MLDIDRTYRWGSAYLDICGSLHSEFGAGFRILWNRITYSGCERDGRESRISFHLLWWTVSIGREWEVDAALKREEGE